MEGSEVNPHDESFLGQQQLPSAAVPDVCCELEAKDSWLLICEAQATAAKCKPGKSIRQLKITPQGLWWDLMGVAIVGGLSSACWACFAWLLGCLQSLWTSCFHMCAFPTREASLSICPPSLSPDVYAVYIFSFTDMVFRINEVLALRSAVSRSHASCKQPSFFVNLIFSALISLVFLTQLFLLTCGGFVWLVLRFVFVRVVSVCFVFPTSIFNLLLFTKLICTVCADVMEVFRSWKKKIESASFSLSHPMLGICINTAQLPDPHGSSLKHLCLIECTGYPVLAFNVALRFFLLPIVGSASLLHGSTHHYCTRLLHTW